MQIKNKPIIRFMQESDIHEVAALEKATFSDAWTEKGIYDTWKQSQAFVVVAEENDNIIGYCIIYYVLDEGEIARIAVDSTNRKQGVGRQILDYVVEVCNKKEITTLLLDVRESNETARRFYQKYGFLEDGIRKNFYEGPREHAVLMSMQIEKEKLL